MRRGGRSGEAGPIAAAFEHGARIPGATSAHRSSSTETKGMIESEIVIVDDDGNEEPFDPLKWFDGDRDGYV
jgi:hypothetical protein